MGRLAAQPGDRYCPLAGQAVEYAVAARETHPGAANSDGRSVPRVGAGYRGSRRIAGSAQAAPRDSGQRGSPGIQPVSRSPGFCRAQRLSAVHAGSRVRGRSAEPGHPGDHRRAGSGRRHGERGRTGRFPRQSAPRGNGAVNPAGRWDPRPGSQGRPDPRTVLLRSRPDHDQERTGRA